MKQLLILPIALVFGLFSCQKESAPQIVETTPATTNYQFAKAPGGGGSTPCTPVQKVVLKSGNQLSDAFLKYIQVTYTAKPCNKNQKLNINIQIYDYNANKLLDQSNGLPLDGQITFTGFTYGYYKVLVNAYDADTQALVESNVSYIGIVYKSI
jgi:hypothetical protein